MPGQWAVCLLWRMGYPLRLKNRSIWQLIFAPRSGTKSVIPHFILPMLRLATGPGLRIPDSVARESVVEGKSVSGRLSLGGRLIIKKKKTHNNNDQQRDGEQN